IFLLQGPLYLIIVVKIEQKHRHCATLRVSLFSEAAALSPAARHMRFLPFLLCCLFLAAAILPRPASAALRPERLAYGKHGKAVRWHIVALYIDCAMSVTAIAAMLNGKTRKKLINAKTVQRILEISRATSEVKTPKKGARPTRKIKVPAVV
ncbi:MAG: hypothetical protein VXY00_01605, partial [Candidatus Latescibacterota bacterium]|nr:hypothetical protein [Candidatus Latescibacterota bacterium]